MKIPGNIKRGSSERKHRGLITLIMVIILMAILPTACYYDSEEYLFPETGTGCDTTMVTFSQSVLMILENNCLSCHSNTNAPNFGGNIKLQDYNDVKARADDGKLLGSISHASGFIPMPMGTPKMDECNINTIRKWIENGAKNE